MNYVYYTKVVMIITFCVISVCYVVVFENMNYIY